MNDTELRELDAWIAEHVMGWTIFKTTDDWHKAGSPTSRTIQVLDQTPHFDIPKYTTDPAAAMMVLEKCGSENTIAIYFGTDGVWHVEHENIYEDRVDFQAKAETLPLAICLFAKQLFSK